MGQEIDRTSFSAQDYQQFASKLRENLQALRQMLAHPEFGKGETPSIGAELELYIVDQQGRPLPINQQLENRANDSRLTLELNRYNIEANLTAQPIDTSPFKKIEAEMESIVKRLNQLAADNGGRVLPIGILPTLKPRDFSKAMMTPGKRYEVLTQELRKRRKDKFHIKLDGQDSLSARTDFVTCEGANTSLQVHYRSDPGRFVRLYNAIQLITPVLTGIAGNSPFFLGRRLWHETRIPLFKQSIDGRDRYRRALHLPSRVYLGHGWLRSSPFELFAQAVYLYEPLIPLTSAEDPWRMLQQQKLPALSELCLHLGTIWPWNRAVYDASNAGHVRIEMRSLPAGPTSIDMAANAAFFIGVAEGIFEHIDELILAMPYKYLEQNLEFAARSGLEARLLWPSLKRSTLEEQPLAAIVAALLPIAAQGLTSLGIGRGERDRYLDCIAARLATQQTGAHWQLRQFERYYPRLRRDRAVRKVFDGYAARCETNTPVAEWDYD